MKKILAISSLGLSVILGVMFLTSTFNLARAGIEPVPWRPEINQLGAIANILNSADFRVAKSIADPPTTCVTPDPCNGPDLNGAVNRLEAIKSQVSSADDMITSMIAEVMGVEPTPWRGEDLIPALEVVRDAGFAIFERIDDFDQTVPREYWDALDGVAVKALDVSETAQWGIDVLDMRCPCFNDSEWSRIWTEWPAVGVPNQCAEFPSAYTFELGHWVFGNDQAREFIAVIDIVGAARNTACRVQHGNPTSSYDVPISPDQVQFCAGMMRAKAEEAGVPCL